SAAAAAGAEPERPGSEEAATQARARELLVLVQEEEERARAFSEGERRRARSFRVAHRRDRRRGEAGRHSLSTAARRDDDPRRQAARSERGLDLAGMVAEEAELHAARERADHGGDAQARRHV